MYAWVEKEYSLYNLHGEIKVVNLMKKDPDLSTYDILKRVIQRCGLSEKGNLRYYFMVLCIERRIKFRKKSGKSELIGNLRANPSSLWRYQIRTIAVRNCIIRVCASINK